MQLSTSGPGSDALSFIAIDYPMRSIERAQAFVAEADEAVAIRGKSEVESKFGDVISRITMAFGDNAATPAPVKRINPFEAR
ncbi:hypothetical protein O3W44_21870 [Pantoea sp. LMR881]|uniref:hypothetical protein n=1 Tax=Pantoea sp. LMR881 TaxID=3014336 RepID=UPI0022AF4935|nr:hypothetical protein [Pantoea sp. LMR881]MCZ4061179.1 hypothetical protein [Pantoea sp. LMR881]